MVEPRKQMGFGRKGVLFCSTFEKDQLTRLMKPLGWEQLTHDWLHTCSAAQVPLNHVMLVFWYAEFLVCYCLTSSISLLLFGLVLRLSLRQYGPLHSSLKSSFQAPQTFVSVANLLASSFWSHVVPMLLKLSFNYLTVSAGGETFIN